MMDESDYLRTISKTNEHIAALQGAKLQADMANSQVSLERSLRQTSLNCAVALAGIHSYDSREKVIEAAESFLSWLRGNE